jgi:voltage-gated potassium channel
MAGPVAEARSLTLWDVVLMGLLVGSVALMFWYETMTDPAQKRAVEWVDLGLVVLFVGEWAVRVARTAAGGRGRYAARHAWELLGMVPLMAPVPGFLRFLRLVRLVRILRVVNVIGARLRVWERIAKESNIGKIALASGTITLAGATLVWLMERRTNEGFAEFSEALWWAVVTVTTVGYGDITPHTATGRFVAGLLMIVGIGTIGLLASSLASVLVIKKEEDDMAAAPPAMAGGLTQELQALAALHEGGKLTDDEFKRAKAKLLGG